MDIRLIILGSGQDGGSPQVGMRRGVGPPRTASSVALVGSDAPRILFDASPDLRIQWETRLAARYPGSRNPFDAVCITHAHMGHYTGLVHFGKEAMASTATPLYSDPTVIAFLAANEPWRSLFTGGHLVGVPSDAPIEFRGVSVSAIRVPHRDEFSAAVAFSVAVQDEPWALYLPDIDGWETWDRAREVVAAHRVCFLDATFGSNEEVPDRDRAEMPHPTVHGTIERLGGLTDGRTLVLTHINHTNPVADASSELHRRAVDAGFVVAHDGLEIAWTP